MTYDFSIIGLKQIMKETIEWCNYCFNEDTYDFYFSEVQKNIVEESKDKVFPWLILLSYYYSNDRFFEALSIANMCLEIHSAEPEGSLYYEHYFSFSLPKTCLYYSLARAFSIGEIDIHKQNARSYYRKYNQECVRKIEAEKSRKSFYSFRKINEYTLSDLISNSMTVMHPSTMNDTVDSLLIPWNEYHFKHKKDSLEKASTSKEEERAKVELRQMEFHKEANKFYRIRSFSVTVSTRKSILNTLMWAHYADNHKGIAVRYVFSDDFISSSNSSSIKRVVPIMYARPSETIDITNDTIDIETAFLKKSNDWEYENEFRLLSYDTSSEDTHLQIPLDADSRIADIYFGDKCTKQNIQTIIKLFENERGQIAYADKIKYYKMELDPQNVYVMKAVLIDKNSYL